ncbi:glycosyltransferase [Thioclava sp. FR2]|uniref:glycosyltransferase n=1 Tax=Thioclava sp. FR2 TaxID=3445780 RepID=UPI003EBE2E08
MSIPIIGLCRFSFLGRGDWAAWRDAPLGEENAKRAELAASLYAPDRVEQRPWTLENLLLPSLRS